jgi:hypothetical protein
MRRVKPRAQSPEPAASREPRAHTSSRSRVVSGLWALGRHWALGPGLLLAIVAAPSAARAQDSLPPRPPRADTVGTLNLFLDCRAPGCDFNYLRTQLTWVNYVRDRTAAQVHVIATSLATGSGGNQVTLEYRSLIHN